MSKHEKTPLFELIGDILLPPFVIIGVLAILIQIIMWIGGQGSIFNLLGKDKTKADTIAVDSIKKVQSDTSENGKLKAKVEELEKKVKVLESNKKK